MAYYPGDYKVECDRCGFDYLRSQCKKEWTGLIVCHTCFDPKHPQLDIHLYQERIAVPEARVPASTATAAAESGSSDGFPYTFPIILG